MTDKQWEKQLNWKERLKTTFKPMEDGSLWFYKEDGTHYSATVEHIESFISKTIAQELKKERELGWQGMHATAIKIINRMKKENSTTQFATYAEYEAYHKTLATLVEQLCNSPEIRKDFPKE